LFRSVGATLRETHAAFEENNTVGTRPVRGSSLNRSTPVRATYVTVALVCAGALTLLAFSSGKSGGGGNTTSGNSSSSHASSAASGSPIKLMVIADIASQVIAQPEVVSGANATMSTPRAE
jgi:hypothetical protein